MPQLPLGAGGIITYPMTAPAPGLPAIIAVPTAARWRLISVQWTFTCSAVAGNRRPYVECIIDIAGFIRADPNVNVFALSVTPFAGADAGGVLATSGPGRVFSIPRNLLLNAGDTVGIYSATVFDAGDQISIPRIVVEEWINA
jgi:hypothetical protein